MDGGQQKQAPEDGFELIHFQTGNCNILTVLLTKEVPENPSGLSMVDASFIDILMVGCELQGYEKSLCLELNILWHYICISFFYF